VTDQKSEAPTILVTGAASGIGRATATHLAAAGAFVIGADISAEGLAETKESVGDGRMETALMDVSDVAAIESSMASIINLHGPLTGLVNGAGIIGFATDGPVDPADFDRVFAINVRGTFFVTQAAARAFVPGSAVVNVSSTAAFGARRRYPHYSASKAAVLSLTRSLAEELAPDTRVNAICPGIIETPMWAQIDNARASEEGLKEGEAFRAAYGRAVLERPGKPADVADAIAFLLSDQSRYMTGEMLVLDGGIQMRG
jgi:NAD(P)-dependent dehydrogenase (short-subunit alcohol dehydrogenase family)